MERSIIDVVRLRHREGSDIAWEAVPIAQTRPYQALTSTLWGRNAGAETREPDHRRPRTFGIERRSGAADGQPVAAGTPDWAGGVRRLALVTVLQREENLADRAAAEAVRTRIDWQYLLGLPLDDPGFDHTVLSEFRNRVADAGLEQASRANMRPTARAGGPEGPPAKVSAAG